MIKKTISPTLIVFLIFYVLVTFSPFLVIFGGKVPIDIEIEPAFISGLITLSGVLVGFVTAIVATKQPLPLWVNLMILIDWGLILITATEVFEWALGLSLPAYALAWTMLSLISNHLTVVAIFALRLFSK
jgi:hypothetical protein